MNEDPECNVYLNEPMIRSGLERIQHDLNELEVVIADVYESEISHYGGVASKRAIDYLKVAGAIEAAADLMRKLM